jgi:hypothetical protein
MQVNLLLSRNPNSLNRIAGSSVFTSAEIVHGDGDVFRNESTTGARFGPLAFMRDSDP